MEIRFHKKVQVDLNEILKRYYDISFQLGEDFFAEFQIGLTKVSENPRFFHFKLEENEKAVFEKDH